MSVIGTSIAAGVAQTAQQAQEVSRRREKRANDQQRQAREIQEKLDLQEVAVEEGDEVETSTELRIDAQLPEHHTPQQQAQLDRIKHVIEGEQADDETETSAEDDNALPQDDAAHAEAVERAREARARDAQGTPNPDNQSEGDGDGLYHHLDVTG